MFPDIICYDSQYNLNLALLIVPGILLYVFLIPILAICEMSKKAKDIYIAG